ncbi:MAG: amino acid permease, partial [Desulfotomaculales bacterium]
MFFRRVKSIEQLLAAKESGTHRLAKILGLFDLTALGLGAIIGMGVFVLTGVAAALYAGPGVVFSFLVAGLASGLAALVYAELAAAVPVAGSAYTFTYSTLGELAAWLVGWNLVLEYVVAAGAVSIGWSG